MWPSVFLSFYDANPDLEQEDLKRRLPKMLQIFHEKGNDGLSLTSTLQILTISWCSIFLLKSQFD